MSKTILITGATDGIGLATAKLLASSGNNLLIHGRNAEKLTTVKSQLLSLPNAGDVETYQADLSILSEVKLFIDQIKAQHKSLDVLINNAGVYKVNNTRTVDDLDTRFSVNTIAPYLLTKKLVNDLSSIGRVINLSSAAQAPVNINALKGAEQLSDMEAYAQSKLAITMWSKNLSDTYKESGPLIIAVNPGSLLASKMVKEGFGAVGSDISIGAKILVRMSFEEGLEKFSGQYFDNDTGQFSSPHPDSLNKQKSEQLIKALDSIILAKI